MQKTIRSIRTATRAASVSRDDVKSAVKDLVAPRENELTPEIAAHIRDTTVEDLPFIWRMNLPESAQEIYKDAFHRAWSESHDERRARWQAFAEVRRSFERDSLSGKWVAKHADAEREPRRTSRKTKLR